MSVNCIEVTDHDPDTDVRDVRHAWESKGLDTRDGVLVSVRRCSWCHVEQVKGYGGKPRTWRVARGRWAS